MTPASPFAQVLQHFIAQLAQWVRDSVQHFFGDEQDTVVIPAQQDSFNIPHLFSVIVGVCAIIVYPLAVMRTQMNEAGDRFLVMAIICAACLTFGLLQLFPQLYERIRQHRGAKITLLFLVGIYLGIGFREDDFYTDFIGLGTQILLILLALAVIISIFRTTIAQRLITPFAIVLSLFVLGMGMIAVLINVSLTDNFYIINDMLQPLTNLKSYTDYVPGYVHLYQYFAIALDWAGLTAYPQLTMYIIYFFLECMCIAAIALAIHFAHRYMAQPSIWVAIIFTAPLFFIATRPFWDFERIYYTLHLFFYSIVPVRMFTVFSVGAICLWFLARANTQPRALIIYGVLSGIVASIGVFQSNDFGLFAFLALGVAIVFQPLRAWKQRLTLATIYTGSALAWFVILWLINTDIATMNPDYIYIWIRKSVAGHGSFLIEFPGNGLMIITAIIAMWLCVVKLYLVLNTHAHTYAQDAMIGNHFAALVYVTTVAVFGMSYYINHSVMSFQGSSMYIGLGIGMFLLYQLVARIAGQHTIARTLGYANIAPTMFVLLPLVLALVHTPMSYRLNQNEMAIKKMIERDPNAMMDTPEYNELRVAQVEGIYAQLQPLQLRVAYVGSFANIVELYTDVPAASILIHPSGVEVGEAVRNMYCDHMQTAPYDLFISDQGYPCMSMQVVTAEPFGAFFYVRHDFRTTNPTQWQQLRDMANVCPIDYTTGEVRCPTP
jgi:hypothetical protein